MGLDVLHFFFEEGAVELARVTLNLGHRGAAVNI